LLFKGNGVACFHFFLKIFIKEVYNKHGRIESCRQERLLLLVKTVTVRIGKQTDYVDDSITFSRGLQN